VSNYRPSPSASTQDGAIGTLRTLLLAILVFGLIGTSTELLLIGHSDHSAGSSSATLAAAPAVLGHELRRLRCSNPGRTGVRLDDAAERPLL
jgi:hypothetical protein